MKAASSCGADHSTATLVQADSPDQVHQAILPRDGLLGRECHQTLKRAQVGRRKDLRPDELDFVPVPGTVQVVALDAVGQFGRAAMGTERNSPRARVQ